MLVVVVVVAARWLPPPPQPAAAAASASVIRGSSARTIIDKKTVTTFRVGKQVHVTEISDQLTKYLADAHRSRSRRSHSSVTAPDIAGDPELARKFRAHVAETEGQSSLIRNLLEARGEAPSTLKDT